MENNRTVDSPFNLIFQPINHNVLCLFVWSTCNVGYSKHLQMSACTPVKIFSSIIYNLIFFWGGAPGFKTEKNVIYFTLSVK